MTARRLLPAIVLAAAIVPAASASSLDFTFDASNGVHSAEALFSFSDEDPMGPSLTITLTNTMTTDGDPTWLTGLFFDLGGSPELDFEAADGDLITLDGTTQTEYTAEDPAHFWAFSDELAGELPFGGQAYGLGAAGFDIFGPNEALEPGAGSPAGVDGGILPDIDGLTVPPGQEKNAWALGSLSFTFWLPADFDVENASVSNVAFAWGSGFDEVVLQVVPVPAALPIGIAGFGLIVLVRRRGSA